MNTFNKIVWVVIIGGVFLCSPAWEYMTLAVRGDQIALNVCWRRFGPIFPQRWSCESMIRQNLLAIAFSCAFDKNKDDSESMKEICEEMDKVKKAEEALKETNKVETGGGP